MAAQQPSPETGVARDRGLAAATAGSAVARPWPWLLHLLGTVLLASVVAVIYGGALPAPFIFDDKLSVLENPSIRALWPLWGDELQPGPLRPPHDFSTAGRPLVNLTFAVDYHFGRLDPTGYHAFNVIAHFVAALLLWRIVYHTLCLPFFGARIVAAAEPLGFLSALLWAAHPLQTETVEYITQRTELLMALCYLATLYAALRYWSSPDRGDRVLWSCAAMIACTAGMASKEVMVTAPVVVLLFERTFIAGSFRQSLVRSWPLYLGLAASWLLLAVLNWGGVRSASAGFDVGVPAHVWWLTQARVLCLYLKLSVWPWPLVIHYEFPFLDSVAAAWMWLVPALAIGGATLYLVWRRSSTGFAWASVLLVLSPTLIVPIVTEIAAERRMYLPLAALVPWAVVGVYWLLSKGAERLAHSAEDASRSQTPLRLMGALALVLTLVYIGLSRTRAATYNDAAELWADAARHQPENACVQNNWGVVLVESEHPADALPHYERAVELKPDYVEAQSNLGVALVHLGETDRAMVEFERALAINPHYADAHINLGHLLVQKGQLEPAIEHYRQALKRNPYLADLHANLGHVLATVGQQAEAIAELQEAIRIDPQLAEAHLNLGVQLAAQQKRDEAIAHYEAALRAKPDFVEAHSNLGVLLNELQRTPKALEHLREAIRLRPDYAEAHSNLGIALIGAGETAAGVKEFEEAVQLKPDVTGYANLAMAYAQAGRPEQAVAFAERALQLARTQGHTELAKQLEDWLKQVRGGP